MAEMKSNRGLVSEFSIVEKHRGDKMFGSSPRDVDGRHVYICSYLTCCPGYLITSRLLWLWARRYSIFISSAAPDS